MATVTRAVAQGVTRRAFLGRSQALEHVTKPTGRAPSFIGWVPKRMRLKMLFLDAHRRPFWRWSPLSRLGGLQSRLTSMYLNAFYPWSFSAGLRSVRADQRQRKLPPRAVLRTGLEPRRFPHSLHCADGRHRPQRCEKLSQIKIRNPGRI